MTNAHAIVDAFEARTLPKSDWTHAAHLVVGLTYVLHKPLPDAMRCMRDRVRAYNEATGVANTATTGYHETITRFFIVAIAQHVARASDADFDAIASTLLTGPCADSRAPLHFWSKERLMSTEARAMWIEPDRHPLIF